MASTMPITTVTVPVQESSAPDGVRWILGLICLVVAAAASGLLLMKQLGVLDVALPGCGEQSACGALAQGFFGSVPGIGWPTSYLGFTYFIAMMMAWSACWPGVPDIILWIGRLGALFSLGFIIIILVEWKLCPYCITAHVANFGFWITLECSRRREGNSMPAFLTLVFSWIIVTVLLAGGQAHADHLDGIERRANEQQNIDAIVNATLAGGVNPIAQSPGSSPGGNQGTGAGESFAPAKAVVDDPSAFAGRYLYGNPDAPVKIVMLSDYQCPDCKRFEDQVWKILESRDDVSLSVMHFPFNSECNPNVTRTMHANACWAAKFAETAGILGGEETFWKAHRLLFERKGRFTQQDFPLLVTELGLDVRTFQTVMMGQAVDALIAEDVELGGKLGVFFTPMIFVNGVQLKWYQLPMSLSGTVDNVAKAIASGRNDGVLKAPPTKSIKYVQDWQDGLEREIPDTLNVAKGVESDPHNIVLLADYTDRGTKELHERVEKLRSQYPGIRYHILAFPKNPDCNPNISEPYRDRFPSGCAAAKAVKAAGKLGGRDAYWAMVEFLMDSGENVTTPEILAASGNMGLDPDELFTMMNSAQIEALIQTDVLRGKRWGIRTVPAIYVNGKHIPRWKLDNENVVERVVKIAVTGEGE